LCQLASPMWMLCSCHPPYVVFFSPSPLFPAIFFLTILRPPTSTLFPYTTLFRSILLLFVCAMAAAGIFAAMKRVAWYRRYIRITSHKPPLCDPAKQHPNVDTLPL